jgi:RecA-family ATPase
MMTSQQAKTLAHLRAATFGELSSRIWPQRQHVIHPWLEAGESALLWAPTGVGKTMLSLTLGLMAAGGGSFAGWSSDRPQKVLIIDGEMRGRDIAERLDHLCGTIDGIDRGAAKTNLKVIARTLQPVDVPFFDIGDEDTHDAIMSYIQKEGVGLLILDNLTTLAEKMGNENTVADLRSVLTFLMNLKRTDAAVILVHHANKGGGNYRGSTGIATTFEVIIGLTRPDDGVVDRADFRLQFDKHRAKGNARLVCESAWKKAPLRGVIGVQKGPLW